MGAFYSQSEARGELTPNHPDIEAPPVVIDTNRVLDLWLFDDPGVARLKRGIEAGTLRWLATSAMRDELARVLGYPALQLQLARRQRDPAQVLAAFDRWARRVPAAAAAGVRCRDADDQGFVDLALAWRAALFSKDSALIALRRALAPLGVALQSGDAAPAAAPTDRGSHCR